MMIEWTIENILISQGVLLSLLVVILSVRGYMIIKELKNIVSLLMMIKDESRIIARNTKTKGSWRIGG